MSAEQAGDRSADFSRLISSLKLTEVRQTAIESRRLGDLAGGEDSDLKLEWKQAFGKEDPVKVADLSIRFRTRYEFNASSGSKPVFRHLAEYFIFFELADAAVFWSLWPDEELQEIFRNRQVLRTLWPFLRQQVLEGMLRLGLQPVTLPWLM